MSRIQLESEREVIYVLYYIVLYNFILRRK